MEFEIIYRQSNIKFKLQTGKLDIYIKKDIRLSCNKIQIEKIKNMKIDLI